MSNHKKLAMPGDGSLSAAAGPEKELSPGIVYRMIKTAEDLLHDVIRNHGDKEFYCIGTGGFMASLDNGTLALQFILSESTAEPGDYIETKEDEE